MVTLTNGEDRDEMTHYAAFHQGLHCMLRQNQSSAKELYFFFEIITCNHSLCTMDSPDLTISNLMENSITGTLANSEDPDEMPHYAAFHQGLHCLLSQNQSLEREYFGGGRIITCNHSICTMDHPDLTISNLMENFTGL